MPTKFSIPDILALDMDNIHSGQTSRVEYKLNSIIFHEGNQLQRGHYTSIRFYILNVAQL